jgi:arylsulfatase A-like enzyme
MKAIMLMFDSLNRRMLEPYGCDWVRTPNFRRLAERAATFDVSFVGSMPCMPARRELHTGRYNFLHRSWGPLEPFDDSMPEILKRRGVYTRLVSDHYHYWEDGGCTYHPRYSSHEFHRGQEGDPWKADLDTPIPESRNNEGRPADWMKNDWMNRRHIRHERDWPQARTFAGGLEFLETNHAQDNWFLTIETFDPHEPYFAPERYRKRYPHGYRGPHFDWPRYGRVTETSEEVEHLRMEAAALHSMCDAWLGRFLDTMDRLDLWRDTLLIVNTDHGFLLGEHDWWAKCCQPFYNEVAHTPLFIWDPRCAVRGERRRSLVQTIDLAPTVLDFFGAPIPADMQGRPLRETVAADAPVRDAGLFGLFGGHVNITDGRYVYMRAPVRPENTPLYEYTLMPTHMRSPFAVEDFADMQSVPPFAFTKGCRLMRLPARPWVKAHEFGHLLFDLAADPAQERPLRDPAVEQRMVRELVRLLHESAAPAEQFERLGVPTHVP